MSGIGAGHNKFESCQGCPDRCADPNCHMTCKGYIYRQEQFAKLREEKQFVKRSRDVTQGVVLQERRYRK